MTAVLGAAADELSVAKEALRDGLWNVARTHATNAIDTVESRLVVLESLAREGKWPTIKDLLGKWSDAKGPGFDYYRAVIRGDHAAAMSALKAGGSPEGLTEVRLHEAETLAKEGKRTAAAAIWRELAVMTNASDRVRAVASSNLMDADLLRKTYATVRTLALRRMVGLRLGVALMHDEHTVAEGERLVRNIVKETPDAEGARDAFLEMADNRLSGGRWNEAVEAYREAIEIWPDAARIAGVQEGRGWALQRLGKNDEALEAFRSAAKLATDDDARATAMLKEGDVLAEMGRDDESMKAYRLVMEKYPRTTVAEKLKTVIRLREMEAEGRRLYKSFRFQDAMKVFGQVGEEDSSRRQRMRFFSVLCLYGQGLDDEAIREARSLVATSPDPSVRADATMWLAKFLYNRREWKESGRLFSAYSEYSDTGESAAEALLWASRCALAENDFNLAIQLTTRLSDRYPNSSRRPSALLVQGEALVELARFDEAVLVFERVAMAEDMPAEERQRAQIQKADALYAMGADNSARYEAALEAYRAVRFGETLSDSGRLLVAFKIARTLEKLRRVEEADDQYYTQVVLAYREGRLRGVRFSDEARAAFSRAAFHLADEYEIGGKDAQATSILELVVESDVPASEEARRRIEGISTKGRFL